MTRPSPRQEELLRAMEEHGPLPNYFHQATVGALLRHGWIETIPAPDTGRGTKLAITTRGRWALRRLDAERQAV